MKTTVRTRTTPKELNDRAYDHILKVTLIVADLEGSEPVLANHLVEAIQYRSLDRESWTG